MSKSGKTTVNSGFRGEDDVGVFHGHFGFKWRKRRWNFPCSFWVSVKKMTLEFSMVILSLSENDVGIFHGHFGLQWRK